MSGWHETTGLRERISIGNYSVGHQAARPEESVEEMMVIAFASGHVLTVRQATELAAAADLVPSDVVGLRLVPVWRLSRNMVPAVHYQSVLTATAQQWSRIVSRTYLSRYRVCHQS